MRETFLVFGSPAIEEAEIEEVAKGIAGSEKLLANEDFLAKAPEQVVERERSKLTDYHQRQAKLQERLRSLQD